MSQSFLQLHSAKSALHEATNVNQIIAVPVLWVMLGFCGGDPSVSSAGLYGLCNMICIIMFL